MKRLFRSKTDRKICGVCGGLGKFLDIDPTIFRVAFALILLFYGVGIIPYLLLAVFIPNEE